LNERERKHSSDGTPDLSGRTFNHAGSLPHECGVPLACPGISAQMPVFCKFATMSEMKTQDARAETPDPKLDASLRLPLLALLGGAAVWLVLGSVLAMIGSIKFHAPDFLANVAWLTYGRVQPAADDALLYGFCIPAGLATMLWLFAHLGQTPLRGVIVPLVAANLWHLGVFIGLLGILSGNSTGYPWLEFPRAASVTLFFAYLLLAMWAMMNFAARRAQELEPTHWFLVAALFWFPWIYSTANLLLVTWPVRGVAQAVIGWWFADNLLFVWLALVGIGTAFYFLPHFSGRPLQNRNLALYAVWNLILFGTWCGIPPGAPLPAWLPAASSFAAALTIVPVLVIAIIMWKTLRGPVSKHSLTPYSSLSANSVGGEGRGEVARLNSNPLSPGPLPAQAGRGSCQQSQAAPPTNCEPKGGPFCFIRFGTASFLLSALMFLAMDCPRIARVTEFTWFGPAQTQLQLYGFFAMTMFGVIYYLVPRVMGFDWPFPKLARLQFFVSMIGVMLFVIPLAIGGVLQGLKLSHPDVAFLDAIKATLFYFRFSTVGLLFILLGNLLFALNVFGLTFVWKLSLLKQVVALVKAPLPDTLSRKESEVKA
jgi:cytochrome c oxidase cbb3-type subunit I